MIPKSSDLSKVQNYRPIFLLCILSKTLESIIYNKNNRFHSPLHLKTAVWFSKKSLLSVSNAFLFSFIVNSIETKKPCDIVFLDFRKAFDTIPHPELLLKLWTHGITGPLWKWFQAYLSNCLHYCQ